MHLSHGAARALMLAAQGLDRRRALPPTKDDVLAAIRRMEAVQIDTIHVVARSPYLVLWSRLGDYRPEWLDELLAEGKLFEYWSHAACFLPAEDYPLYRRQMLEHAYRFFHSAPHWIKRHAEAVEHVLAFSREHGEVRSSDFERTDGQQSGWFNWKEEKIALEALLATGELMIARRHNFHRVYDLRERILQRMLPGWEDSQAPPLDEVKRALALKAVRALGVTPWDWVPDYFRTPKIGAEKLLKELASQGELITVEVDGWKKLWYVHPDNATLAEAAASGRLPLTLTTLQSPFDPLVWDRERCKAMFDFDYRIECYTPEAKRRYGYFTLPVLRRGLLIGRLDAKARRKEGLFEVKGLWLPRSAAGPSGLSPALRPPTTAKECARTGKLEDLRSRALESSSLFSFRPFSCRAMRQPLAGRSCFGHRHALYGDRSVLDAVATPISVRRLFPAVISQIRGGSCCPPVVIGVPSPATSVRAQAVFPLL